MTLQVDSQALKTLQIEILDVSRGRFHYYLELIVVLQAVRILAIAPVSRPAGRLNICYVPCIRPEDTQKSGRVKGSRTYLHIKRLMENTPLIGPESA